MLVVDYERCSFPKGSDYRDLTGKSLVFWMGGRTGRFDCNLWVGCAMHDFESLSVEHFYTFWKIIHCVLCDVVFVILSPNQYTIKQYNYQIWFLKSRNNQG